MDGREGKWRVTWICRKMENHTHQRVQVLDRSPLVDVPEVPYCEICCADLKIGKIEDLRPREYNIRRKRTRAGGFKAEQLVLF